MGVSVCMAIKLGQRLEAWLDISVSHSSTWVLTFLPGAAKSLGDLLTRQLLLLLLLGTHTTMLRRDQKRSWYSLSEREKKNFGSPFYVCGSGPHFAAAAVASQGIEAVSFLPTLTCYDMVCESVPFLTEIRF